MAIVYRSVLHEPDENPLKKYYKNKVFNSTGVTAYTISGYDNRATVNEGQLIYNSTTKEVFIYVDFTITRNMGYADYWAYFMVNNSLGATFCPQTYTGTKTGQTLYTDPSSTNPKKSFFIRDNGTYCNLARSNAPDVGERYIVYGGWQNGDTT